MKIIAGVICMVMLGLWGCDKITPSSFWKAFRSEYLKEDISNQGPQGGHRAMYWKSNEGVFKSQEVIKYANENDWKLADSLEVQAEDVNKWVYGGSPIFPLSHEGFSAKPLNNSTHSDFPRWIKVKSKVYMFKTGWTVIEPGTNEANDINGFVLLSMDGSEMSVYHIWGEQGSVANLSLQDFGELRCYFGGSGNSPFSSGGGSRPWQYNAVNSTLGVGYHDIIGGNDQMKINATWQSNR